MNAHLPQGAGGFLCEGMGCGGKQKNKLHPFRTGTIILVNLVSIPLYLHDGIGGWIKCITIGIQIVADSIALLGWQEYAIQKGSNKPWRRSVNKYNKIFEDEIKRKQRLQHNQIKLGKVCNFMIVCLVWLAIVESILFFINSWNLLPNFETIPANIAGYLRPWLSPALKWLFSHQYVIILCLMITLIGLWHWELSQRRIIERRMSCMIGVASLLKKEHLDTDGSADDKATNGHKIRKLIEETMRLALQATDYHTRLKKLVTINRSRLGPKSIWIFLPDSNNGHFNIAEMEMERKNDNYEIYSNIVGNYHPKLLDMEKWNLSCQKAIEELSRGESESLVKRKLFEKRFECASDLGIIAEHGQGELLFSIDRQCKMLNPDYLKYICKNQNTHRFRSAVVMPIPYNRDNGSSTAQPILAMYSPAVGEFNGMDYSTLSFYANILALLFKHYEKHCGPYPSK